MATGDKFERHRQGGAAEQKRSLCRETATSPADGRFSDPIDEQPFRHAGVDAGHAAAGFTPVTAHANRGN